MSEATVDAANTKEECVDDLKVLFWKLFLEIRAYDGCEGIAANLNEDGRTFVRVVQWASQGHYYEKHLAWRTETGLCDVLTPRLPSGRDAQPDAAEAHVLASSPPLHLAREGSPNDFG